jgi:hypothetical protein
MTDFDIAHDFFEMLKKNGVDIHLDIEDGLEATIRSRTSQGSNGDTLTFCFDEETGEFNRIMGYVGKYYSDEVFKK